MELLEATKRFSGLMRDLTALLKLLNKDDRICCGLTWQQAFTIETLFVEGSMSMGPLAARMGVAESTATRILNILDRDRYLRRRSFPGDRRQVLAELSPRGTAAAKTLIRCREDAIRRMMGSVQPKGRKELIAAMEKVKAFAQNASCC